ncbi:cupin domain-containing protein [Vallitalea okinawensis]|uniref:cupin domain-containing protein n=1 Tax=Vallitalea okinawensis TaxID=2078660 RepID=UPI000CFB9EFF|nr:cupin domain-containing protein [Vallitalea okinawensis]
MTTQKNLIDLLKLEPHPEGGFYRQVYKAEEILEDLPSRFDGARSFSTAIYFLLTKETFSAFHIINQDELWHHYEGGTLKIHIIDQDGNYSFKCLGKNLMDGEEPMVVVPKETYFAAEVIEGDFVLSGCTVAPGFEFSDFKMPDRRELIEQFPDQERIITELTQ